MTWALGATGDNQSYQKFDTFFRELVGGKLEAHPIPDVVGKIECPMPPEGLVHDYLFEPKGRGKWTQWLETIKGVGIDPAMKKLSDIIVPTMDTARWTPPPTPPTPPPPPPPPSPPLPLLHVHVPNLLHLYFHLSGTPT